MSHTRKILTGVLLSIVTAAAIAPAIQASAVSVGSGSGVIADVNRRVQAGDLDVSVHQGSRRVQLRHIVQLLVITPKNGKAEAIEGLVGASVAVVPSAKRPGQLELHLLSSAGLLGDEYSGLRPVAYETAQQPQNAQKYTRQQMLADNVFVVEQVFVSSRRNPVLVKLDGQMIRLKRGDALLVL